MIKTLLLKCQTKLLEGYEMRIQDSQRNNQNKFYIDDNEIEQRKKFVSLDSDDIKKVLKVADIVAKHADEFTKQFFDHLSKFNEARGILAPTILEEATRLKKDHLLNLVSGKYDRNYVEERIKIGAIYGKAGLAPKLFLGAFHCLMRFIGEKIMLKYNGSKDEAFLNFISLKKISFFDLGIIVDCIVYDREQTIRQQQEAIRELSTPVLQLKNRLLILPIIGMIDTYRAKILTENLLRAIRDNRAKMVVIDITGVAAVDSKVANHLVQTVTAAKLMGAHVIVTGLSPEIAQTLVTLGAELLSALNTVGDLQGGIEEAEKILSQQQNLASKG